jgi:hypothetical protein
MYLNVAVIHRYRFAFFLATFFGAFFFPTAFRPADDLVFFADFFDDFLAVSATSLPLMTAPIASAWSDCRVGLHPLESAAFARRTP